MLGRTLLSDSGSALDEAGAEYTRSDVDDGVT